jgi:hypothetical protein
MADPHYDILFKGEVNDGFPLDEVKNGIGQLFKLPPEKVEQLFSGKPVTLKKGLDRPSALKFRQALESKGAKVYIRIAEAEKVLGTASPKPETIRPEPQVPSQPAQPSSLTILPPGSDVLTKEERVPVPNVVIDTSAIKLASAFETTGRESAPPPPAPDVSHISVAPPGADVLEGYHEDAPPLPEPDISHISVAEVGADIDPSPKAPPPPAPDVSHIRLAPAS